MISKQAEPAQFVPEARTKFYDWLPSGKHPAILGWKGVVTNIVGVPQGFQVRIRVEAVFDEGFFCTVRTDETYLVSDGQVYPLAIVNADPDAPRVLTRP